MEAYNMNVNALSRGLSRADSAALRLSLDGRLVVRADAGSGTANVRKLLGEMLALISSASDIVEVEDRASGEVAKISASELLALVNENMWGDQEEKGALEFLVEASRSDVAGMREKYDFLSDKQNFATLNRFLSELAHTMCEEYASRLITQNEEGAGFGAYMAGVMDAARAAIGASMDSSNESSDSRYEAMQRQISTQNREMALIGELTKLREGIDAGLQQLLTDLAALNTIKSESERSTAHQNAVKRIEALRVELSQPKQQETISRDVEGLFLPFHRVSTRAPQLQALDNSADGEAFCSEHVSYLASSPSQPSKTESKQNNSASLDANGLESPGNNQECNIYRGRPSRLEQLCERALRYLSELGIDAEDVEHSPETARRNVQHIAAVLSKAESGDAQIRRRIDQGELIKADRGVFEQLLSQDMDFEQGSVLRELNPQCECAGELADLREKLQAQAEAAVNAENRLGAMQQVLIEVLQPQLDMLRDNLSPLAAQSTLNELRAIKNRILQAKRGYHIKSSIERNIHAPEADKEDLNATLPKNEARRRRIDELSRIAGDFELNSGIAGLTTKLDILESRLDQGLNALRTVTANRQPDKELSSENAPVGARTVRKKGAAIVFKSFVADLARVKSDEDGRDSVPRKRPRSQEAAPSPVIPEEVIVELPERSQRFKSMRSTLIREQQQKDAEETYGQLATLQTRLDAAAVDNSELTKQNAGLTRQLQSAIDTNAYLGQQVQGLRMELGRLQPSIAKLDEQAFFRKDTTVTLGETGGSHTTSQPQLNTQASVTSLYNTNTPNDEQSDVLKYTLLMRLSGAAPNDDGLPASIIGFCARKSLTHNYSYSRNAERGEGVRRTLEAVPSGKTIKMRGGFGNESDEVDALRLQSRLARLQRLEARITILGEELEGCLPLAALARLEEKASYITNCVADSKPQALSRQFIENFGETPAFDFEQFAPLPLPVPVPRSQPSSPRNLQRADPTSTGGYNEVLHYHRSLIEDLRYNTIQIEQYNKALLDEVQRLGEKNREYAETLSRAFASAKSLVRDSCDEYTELSAENLDAVIGAIRAKMSGYMNAAPTLRGPQPVRPAPVQQEIAEVSEEEEKPTELRAEARDTVSEKSGQMKKAFEDLISIMFTYVQEGSSSLSRLEALLGAGDIKSALEPDAEQKMAEELLRLRGNSDNLLEMIECLYENLMQYFAARQDNDDDQHSSEPLSPREVAQLQSENRTLHEQLALLLNDYDALSKKHAAGLEREASLGRKGSLGGRSERLHKDFATPLSGERLKRAGLLQVSPRPVEQHSEAEAPGADDRLGQLVHLLRRIHKIAKNNQSDSYKMMKIEDILETSETRGFYEWAKEMRVEDVKSSRVSSEQQSVSWNAANVHSELIAKENQILLLEDEINLLNQKVLVYEQEIDRLKAEGGLEAANSKLKLKKRIAELGKRVVTTENTNSELIADLQTKNARIRELEALAVPLGRTLTRELSSAKLSANKHAESRARHNAAVLKEENANLKDQVLSLTQELHKRHAEPRSQFPRPSDPRLSESAHKGHRSVKRSVDVIRYENELRQKNRYIDSLLEKIKELQAGHREQAPKGVLSASQAFRKDGKGHEQQRDA